MTGALWAKRGERDISRRARHEREARDEEKRKSFIFLFPSSRASRSPRLAHKGPVMQASAQAIVFETSPGLSPNSKNKISWSYAKM